jgi:2-C-methyl-D-erythritol 4-phosphate cytidylyltransferase
LVFQEPAVFSTGNRMNTAIIVAAGQGTRMGGTVRKPYLPLDGVPILGRTLRAFTGCGLFQEIILVVAASEMAFCRRHILHDLNSRPNGHPTIRLVAGGGERQESVCNGLEASDGQDDDAVLIHDGVRPFVAAEDLACCLEAVKSHGACITAVPSCDTLKEIGSDGGIVRTLPRQTIWLAQTPQGFRLGLIRAAHRRAREEGFIGTDDAQLVERLGHTVAIVPGRRLNIKITTPEDLRLAEAIWRHAHGMADSRGGEAPRSGAEARRRSPGGHDIPDEG